MKLSGPKQARTRCGGHWKKAFVPQSLEGTRSTRLPSDPNFTIISMSLGATRGMSAGRTRTESALFLIHQTNAFSIAEFKPLRRGEKKETPYRSAIGRTFRSLLTTKTLLTTDAFSACKTSSSMATVKDLRSCKLKL